MKKYWRMKKRFALCCSLALLMACMGIPMVANAEEGKQVYEVLHHHVAGCQETIYETMDADGRKYLRTVNTDTCPLCNGHHDYYAFDADCSCGKSWYTTGHACLNSPYGTNHGTCSNYSVIDCTTSHQHPVQVYVCGKTEETIIGTVTLEPSTLSPARQVVLKATAEGEMEDVTLSWEDTEGKDTITVTENGTYRLYISYTENGIEYLHEMEADVNNVDRKPPTVSDIKTSEAGFTSGKVTLSVTAKDETGLPDKYVSWNGGAFGSDTTFEVKENGTYEVVVKDEAGNTVKKTITIDNIDTASPVITALDTSPVPWYEGSCTVIVKAEDKGNGNQGSGLAELPYSWDEGATWTDKSTHNVEESGTVNIWVKDAVGNVVKDSVEVVKEVKPTPPPAPEPDTNQGTVTPSAPSPAPTPAPTPVPAEPVVVPEANTSVPKETVTVQPVEKDDTTVDEWASDTWDESDYEEEEDTLKYQFLPEPEKIEVVTIPMEDFYAGEEKELETLDADENAFNPVVLIGIITGCAGLGILGMIVFLLFGLCKVYEVGNHRKENYLGSVGVRLHKKGYRVVLGENILSKSGSRNLKIKIPAWFVKLNEYKPLSIVAGKTHIDQYVEQEVEVHVEV